MLYNILDIKCKFVYPSNENLGIISIYFFTIIKKDPVYHCDPHFLRYGGVYWGQMKVHAKT